MTKENGRSPDRATAAGANVYSKTVLSIYDWYVLGFSNSFVWRCPSRLILDFYNEHVSDKHLDVGVGTGYFLDKCEFPSATPTIVLADLNENSLQATANRLARYNPATYVTDVLQPLHLEPAEFKSIALNYLLHCLPGDMVSKGAVFKNLKPLLHPKGGVIFGTTILGQGVRHNFMGNSLMRIYNNKGIFTNYKDNLADLDQMLQANFSDYTTQVVGCVAFFRAQI